MAVDALVSNTGATGATSLEPESLPFVATGNMDWTPQTFQHIPRYLFCV